MKSEAMSRSCGACADGVDSPFPFTMAFQPIVDVNRGTVFAYEALVRGLHNESAFSILSQVTAENKYKFDQSCRVQAITLAKRLKLPETGALLSINFMPGAVYDAAACIQLTLKTAARLDFPLRSLIFEITESEKISDRSHLARIASEYRKHGFSVALDDFGSGYSGLNVLADIQVEILKLDMDLTRNIDSRPIARSIVRAMVSLCETLGTLVVAEGVETLAEFHTLRACGIGLMQGYLLAKPGFEMLPDFVQPEADARLYGEGHTLRPALAKSSTDVLLPIL